MFGRRESVGKEEKNLGVFGTDTVTLKQLVKYLSFILSFLGNQTPRLGLWKVILFRKITCFGKFCSLIFFCKYRWFSVLSFS